MNGTPEMAVCTGNNLFFPRSFATVVNRITFYLRNLSEYCQQDIFIMQCICCSSTDSSERGRKNGYSIYICDRCGCEFVYPMPTNAELEQYYNDGMNKDLKERIAASIEDLEKNPNHPHRDWFKEILQKVEKISGKKRMRILEIGSSMGSFVHIANTLGHDAIGTEISEETADVSKGIINGQILYTGSSPYDKLFAAESFDLIYMEHVLEHVTDPAATIAQLATLLKPDGVLSISVPNQASWLAKLYGMYWDWMSPPLHLYYFNKMNLGMLLQRYDLNIVQDWTGEYYFRSVFQFFTLSMFVFRMKQIMNTLFKTTFTTEYNFDYHYKYPGSTREIFNILPYFVLYPVIKMFSAIGMGNDLTVFARKR